MNSDEFLLQKAQECDEGALGELYDRYAPQIYRYLYRRVQNAQVAEDLTGDVFVRVLRAVHEDRFSNVSFGAWLYRIAHNLVIDHYRRNNGDKEVDDEFDEGQMAAWEDLDAVLTERLSRRSLRAAISRLSPLQQQVLALRFGEQLATHEVAAVIG
ncbi:MAG: sigma-70 family RNA polymerase sigma factor, partial [Chloroflexi bacterium]|nr:sigma-70 family RNA polymerase sigma factor [Chloroflexota bacterium]